MEDEHCRGLHCMETTKRNTDAAQSGSVPATQRNCIIR